MPSRRRSRGKSTLSLATLPNLSEARASPLYGSVYDRLDEKDLDIVHTYVLVHLQKNNGLVDAAVALKFHLGTGAAADFRLIRNIRDKKGLHLPPL